MIGESPLSFNIMKKDKNTPFVQITPQNIESYAREMTTPESSTMQELVRSSDRELKYIDMLSGNLVAQLLKMLINISGAKRILELGTFTGYSAIAMAEVLPEDGEIITIEMNQLYQEIAERHIERFDHSKKITLMKGDARELIKNIEGDFDLIFIDADKLSYKFYYQRSVELVRQGGLIITDNVLWDGTVLQPRDHKAKAMDQFNTYVAQDARVEQILLPVRDGLTLIRKK